MLQLILLSLPSLALAFTVSNLEAENPFAKLQEPVGKEAKIYGTYNAGCISGALPLNLHHPRYTVMRTFRGHYYAHPNLLKLIERAALESPREKHLLIGDTSQAAGGPMPMGHASHQI